VMDFCRHGSLSDWVQMRGELALSETGKIIIQLLGSVKVPT
jgi:hypothetical protein